MKTILYTKNDCPRCKAAGSRLRANGVEYDIINLDENEEHLEAIKSAGYLAAPILRVGETYYPRMTDILTYAKNFNRV